MGIASGLGARRVVGYASKVRLRRWLEASKTAEPGLKATAWKFKESKAARGSSPVLNVSAKVVSVTGADLDATRLRCFRVFSNPPAKGTATMRQRPGAKSYSAGSEA